MAETDQTISPVKDPVRAMMLNHVIGFGTPVYSQDLPNGRTMHALNDPDLFQQINEGYACGQCLARFDTYMQVCPVCGLNREKAAEVQTTPDDWNAFYDEHLNGTGKTKTRTPDEFFTDLAADRDVDQTTISALKPRRRK